MQKYMPTYTYACGVQVIYDKYFANKIEKSTRSNLRENATTTTSNE